MKPTEQFETTTIRPFANMWCAILLMAGLLTAQLASAQTLKFRFNFEDTGTTTTDTASGVVLNMVNSSGTATDYHGAAGTGVGGVGKALNLTSGADGGSGPVVSTTNNATLGFGSVSSWTVTEWVNPSATSANLARLFIFGTNGVVDINTANSFAFKVKSTSSCNVYINATEATSVEPTISLPLGSWTFIAYTYDGTTLSMYVGSTTTAAQLVGSSASYSGQSINFGTAGSLFLGNRSSNGRCFKGYIDDTRFYTGAGNAAFVESVRQAGLPVLATEVWDNGAGTMNWNTSDANWNSGGKWTNANSALFGAAGVGTVSVKETISANNVTVTNAGYTIADGGGTMTINGAITNNVDVGLSAFLSGKLVKAGSGNLTASALETYTGNTIVNGGTLTIDAALGGLYQGSVSGNVQINSGGTLSFSGGISYQSQAFKNLGPSVGTIVINGGTLQHTGNSNAKSSSAAGSGHLFDIGALGATLDSATAGQEFSLGYRYDYSAPGVLASAGGNLTLSGDGDGDLNFLLPGTGGLIKLGAGTWKLSNSNSYSGPTIIVGGTLQLTNGTSVGGGQGNGSISLTPSITISNGATFDVTGATGGFTLGGAQSLLGFGTVAGAVNTASGSAIYPGLDLVYGTNTFASDLTLVSGANLYFDVGTSATGSNDQIIVVGNLTMTSPTFHIKAPSTSSSLATNADYVLMTVTGTISGSPASAPVWDVQPLNTNNFKIVVAGNNVVLRRVAATPPTFTSASISPAATTHFGNITIAAAVTPGSSAITSVTVNATPIGGSASAALVSAGGNVWTNTLIVGASAVLGVNTLALTATDASLLSAVTNASFTVLATNRIWSGNSPATANWSDNTNWVGNAGPGLSGDSVVFTGSTQTAPVMDANYSVTSITFDTNASAFTLGTVSSSLTLAGGLTNNSASLQAISTPVVLVGTNIINTASNDMTLQMVVSGGGGLVKIGAGNLELGNGGFPVSETYSGPTTINGGSLTVDGKLYQQSGNTVTINSGGVLILPNGTDFGWGGSLGFSGISGGGLIINGGTIRKSGFGNSQTSTGAGRLFTIGALGATLESAEPGQTFSLGFRYDYPPIITSTAGGNLTLTGVGNGVLDYILPGTGGLVMNGSGNWLLTQTNTYSGNTIVNSGTLEIAQPYLKALSSVVVSNGGMLQLDFAVTNQIAALVLNGVVQPPGVYSSANASSYLSGSGFLLVQPPSTNDYLLALKLNPVVSFVPTFVSNVLSGYVATVPFGSTPTVTVTNADLTASNVLFLNTTNRGGLVSGIPSSGLNVTFGITNVLQVLVTAQDGHTTNLYTVNVVMQPKQPANYYVDSAGGNDANSGTNSAAPWQSLTNVNASTFVPGDHIYLKAGSVWTGQLNPKGSGDTNAQITIDMYGSGAKPVVNGGDVWGGAFYLWNQQYWSINNLELSNYGTNNVAKKKGMLIMNDCVGTLNSIYVRNCYIHNVSGVMTNYADGKESGGIVFQISSSNTNVPSKWNDIRIENNVVTDVAREGILMQSFWVNKADTNVNWGPTYGNYYPSTQIRIASNSLARISGDGIILWAVNGATVEYNTLSQCNSNSLGQGHAALWPYISENVIFQFNEVSGTQLTADGTAFDFDNSDQNCIYQYNYSHDNQGGFLLMTSYGISSNNICRYNISQNDGCLAGSRVFWLAGGGNKNYSIYNNTIYVNSNNPEVFRDGGGVTSNSIVAFKNNIIYNQGTGAVTAPAGCSFDYNLYYGNGSISSDPHKVLANPQLVSAGSGSNGLSSVSGYQLTTTSPALGVGILIPANGGFDYWGNAVSAVNAPNIGAYNGSGYSVIPGTPTNLVWSVIGPISGTNYLRLSWPQNYVGWQLQAQTNHLASGVSSNPNDWGVVSGSATTNVVLIPISTSKPGGYYRMVH